VAPSSWPSCAGELLGFATLYATLETLATAPILVMNDLFVVPSERGAGIGEALISTCRKYARDHGYASLDWVTAADNHTARKLYDRLGSRVGPWISYSLDPAEPR
jgi:GNAT superfamily N-acetyltransferase